MSKQQVPLLATLALLFVLAAVALVITEFHGTDAGTAQESGATSVGGPLRVSNRVTRSLCYTAVGGQTVTSDHRDRLDQAVDMLGVELAGHPFPTVELTRGCPPPAAADEAHRSVDPKTGEITALGPITETPSMHVIHLYFVEQDLFLDWFGGQPWVITGEEIWCGNPRTFQCSAITKGIYVTPSATADTLHESMIDAIGLRSPLDDRGSTPTATPTGP